MLDFNWSVLFVGAVIISIVNKDNLLLWAVVSCCFMCQATGRAQEATPKGSEIGAAFSQKSNFMSPVGLARWKHFQQTGEWPPCVLKKIIAESPINGGFGWLGFLEETQTEVEQHPFVRKFVLSWHIDTIGPDWQDNYLITLVYERDRGIIYDPHKYPEDKNGVYVLRDDLIPVLQAKLREFYALRAGKRRKNPRLADADEDPEILFRRWWLEHIR